MAYRNDTEAAPLAAALPGPTASWFRLVSELVECGLSLENAMLSATRRVASARAAADEMPETRRSSAPAPPRSHVRLRR
jgi:hypothetical protein